MASFDLNAQASGAWTAASAIVAGSAKPASDPPSRPKMAVNANTGNIQPDLLRREDPAALAGSLEAQMFSNDFAYVLFTMLYGNHPTLPNGLMLPGFPMGLPQQQFRAMLPPNRNISPLQHTTLDRNVATKTKQRTPNSKSHTSRSERKNASPVVQRSSTSTSSSSSTQYMVGKNDLIPNYATNGLSDSIAGMLARGNAYPLNSLAPPSEIVKSGRPPCGFRQRIPAQVKSPTISSAPNSGHLSRLPKSFAVSSMARSSSNNSSSISNPTARRKETTCHRSQGMIAGKPTARSFQSSHNSTFNEAEAAATLLGMRHGQSSRSGELPLTSAVPKSVVTSRGARPIPRNFETVPRQSMNELAKPSTSNVEQAVDLSTKSKLKSQHTREISTVNAKSTCNTCISQLTKAKNVTTVAKCTVNKCCQPREPCGQQFALQEAGANRKAELDRGSHDRKTESTSVVSQYKYCICAFDSPTSMKNCGDLGPALDKASVNQQAVQQQAFNYKKVICEKFSQGTSPGTMTNTNVATKDHAVKSTKAISNHRPVWESCEPSDVHFKPDKEQGRFPIAMKERCASLTTTQDQRTANILYSTSTSQIPYSRTLVPAYEKNPRNETSQKSCDAVSKPSHSKTKQDHLSKEKRVSTTVASSSPQSQNVQKKPISGGITKLGSKRDVPSFSDLRHQSTILNKAGHTNNKLTNSTGHGKSFHVYKTKVPSSNLYRIRNSTFGGSNDSLHSNSTEKEDTKADSGEDSDSSSSSSESDGSGDSDVEDDQVKCLPTVSESPKSEISKNGPSPTKSSPSRSRFILSQPKFTLNNPESLNDVAKSESESNVLEVSPSEVPSNSTPRSVTPCQSPKLKRKKSSEFPSNSTEECNNASQATGDGDNKIPELKFDGNESENTFKYKFMKALSNPDSKEGLAVDGKHLRALLGEATCFYHNNRKYVLKRYLKPKEAQKASDELETTPQNKHSPKDVAGNELSCSPERITQRKIEPRISVTAIKRSESPAKSEIKLHPKKLKKAKKRSSESSKNKSASTQLETGKHVKRSDVDEIKRNMPLIKRRRRNHEIENLVYEGAGGKTPMPDLSLRDSDVFSNIKLRRREAAKRGIIETNISKKDKNYESKIVYCRKRIKTAAHKRAIANKNRKKSIEKKLRKYRKKDRPFVVRKDDSQLQPLPTRMSCVRINAGVARPQLEGKSSEADYENNNGECRRSPNFHDVSLSNHSEQPHNICFVTQEGKKASPIALDDQPKRQTIDTDRDLAKNVKCEEFVSCNLKKDGFAVSAANTIDKPDDLTAAKISRRNFHGDISDLDNHRRRTSRRILEKKQSSDHVTNEKKIEDDAISLSSANFETDSSTRSDSPLPGYNSTTKNHRKRKANFSSRKPSKSITAAIKPTKSIRHEPKQCNFSLISCFPNAPAMTLAAGFGDLTPSYSMKSSSKAGSSSTKNKWNIGKSALVTKQELQRKVWRNMTLNMFTNAS